GLKLLRAEFRDDLRLAIIEQMEIIHFERADLVPARVANHNRDLHQIRRRPENCGRRRRLHFGRILRRGGHCSQSCNPCQSTRSHHGISTPVLCSAIAAPSESRTTRRTRYLPGFTVKSVEFSIPDFIHALSVSSFSRNSTVFSNPCTKLPFESKIPMTIVRSSRFRPSSFFS